MERLHIDYAKEAYRAGNHKDITNNMAQWLVRLEKIEQHVLHVQWPEGKTPKANEDSPPRLLLTKHPSAKAVPITTLTTMYHAPAFTTALQSYLTTLIPSLSIERHEGAHAHIDTINSHLCVIPVWHRLRITNAPVQDVEGISDHSDTAHARPAHPARKGSMAVGERFDTVLVDKKGSAEPAGIDGMYFILTTASPTLISLLLGLRVAQLRVIFKLPEDAISRIFGQVPGPLVYVNWFSRPMSRPVANFNMYSITRPANPNQRESAIISLSSICRSCHLFP